MTEKQSYVEWLIRWRRALNSLRLQFPLPLEDLLDLVTDLEWSPYNARILPGLWRDELLCVRLFPRFSSCRKESDGSIVSFFELDNVRLLEKRESAAVTHVLDIKEAELVESSVHYPFY